MKKVISRKRVALTSHQIDALEQLSKALGFIPLKLHKFTAKRFVEEGWVEVEDDDGTPVYLLTPLGFKILEEFSTGFHMMDGTCPRCKKAPKYNKRLCKACAREYNKISRMRKQTRAGYCSCGKPKKKSKNGKYYERCADCEKAKNSARYRASHEYRVAMAKAGTPVKCIKEGCENPCYISPTGKSSKNICSKCARMLAIKINAESKRKKMAKIMKEM